MSPVKNAVLGPKHNNAVKQNIVSSFFPPTNFPIDFCLWDAWTCSCSAVFLVTPSGAFWYRDHSVWGKALA